MGDRRKLIPEEQWYQTDIDVVVRLLKKHWKEATDGYPLNLEEPSIHARPMALIPQRKTLPSKWYPGECKGPHQLKYPWPNYRRCKRKNCNFREWFLFCKDRWSDDEDGEYEDYLWEVKSDEECDREDYELSEEAAHAS